MINKKGFTLIELMVVVAIIGILASMAVPQFRRFQAKAKQANAKAELSGIYMAEQTFFTEFGVYSAYLAAIGYVPDGFGQDACPHNSGSGAIAEPLPGTQRYYRTGFQGSDASGATWPSQITASPCSITFFAATNGVTDRPNGQPDSSSMADRSFTAAAHGDIFGGGQDDTWTIDQDKILRNVQQGLGRGTNN